MHFGKKLVSVVILIAVFVTFHVTIACGLSYYVQPGDSLYSIAARYGTSVSSLMQTNSLWTTSIVPGQALKINTASTSSTYTVRPGDTLYLIAQRYGTTVDALKQSNNLSNNYLTVGRQLVIPKSTPASSDTVNYQVKSGDTLFLIAQRYGIGLDQLLRLNNMSSGTAIYPGQTLKVPATGNQSSGNSSGSYKLSQNNIDLLARLVTAESDGEPFEGQVAVAATILNRLSDPRYPKTVPDIIYQIDNGRYQYSPVLDGRINNPASASAYRAVDAALTGWDPSKGANGFYNPSKTSSQWVRSHPITAVIGNHVFFNY